MPKDDSVYLGHMLDAAKKVASRIQGKSRQEYDASEDLQMILAYLIQTIGEAASRVSVELRDQNPEIPWKQIVGMRNRIVHDYMNIDADIVWEVATRNIPLLIVQLESISMSGNSLNPEP
jgi:uncharacterized protein with HEPN domain